MYKTLISLAILTSITVNAETAIFRVQLTDGGNYNSTPDSGIDCGLLTGDNRVGLIMAGGSENRTLKKIESYNSGGWSLLRTAPIPVTNIAGDNQSGPIISGGYSARSTAYMNSYAANQWVTLPDAPFEIQGLSGDNRKGPIIFNGNKLAILESYSNPQWNVLNHASFPATQIKGISGDNRYGVIAFSTDNKLGLINNYASGSWTLLTLPPANSKIAGITGSVYSGVVASLENGTVWYLHFSRKDDGSIKVADSWFEVKTQNPYISARELSGDVSNGIAFCQN